MNRFTAIALLAVTYLVVWLQSTFNEFRDVTGVQIDLLPSLVVYTALRSSLGGLISVAVFGGLLYDSVSANPVGVTMLPLFLGGSIIQQAREFILREQAYAQMILGLALSAAAPLVSLLILINIDSKPLIGWFSLWQWLVISVVGAVFTPLWFRIFDGIALVLNYRPVGQSSFRPDREIKRGR
jgi:cell shape-determining protein MreD